MKRHSIEVLANRNLTAADLRGLQQLFDNEDQEFGE